jgi:phosphoglycerate dehydrogenase-like enzyme
VSSLRRIALLYPGSLHADGTGRSALDELRNRHPGIDFRRAEFGSRGGRTWTSPIAGEVRDALASADAVVCLDLPSTLLQLAPRLQWIQTVSAGVDGLPVGELKRAGVRISQAAGAAAPEIAEFVMARILEHHKRLPEIAASAAARSWVPLYGAGLRQVGLGLVGFGAINRDIARLAAAFGMEVRVCRRSAQVPADGAVHTYGFSDLAMMLPQCDVVVCALPETPETIGILGERAFASMSPGTFVVNVGRGSAVDRPALLTALDSGTVAAAALDVFDTEPLPADDPIWRRPDIRVSSHCSAVPSASIERVIDLVSENIGHFVAGRPLTNQL